MTGRFLFIERSSTTGETLTYKSSYSAGETLTWTLPAWARNIKTNAGILMVTFSL